jgi:PBSX family phage terminase large subunit
MTDLFSKKQIEFIANSYRRWNIAHGSVSTGKTVVTLHRFMQAVNDCPDSEIAMIGKTSTTLYNNVIKQLFECPEFTIYKPFCAWHGSRRELTFKDKTITTYGAKDEGSAALIQGRTLSLAYCDEMTLYPDSFIHMLNTRLRKPYSMGFCSMNPSYPDHIIKKWIDKAEEGDPNYYQLHFKLEDNPFVDDNYKKTMAESLSGIFYKRNYLGLWCLAEGSIFECFDRASHVLMRPPLAAEYFVAGIDYGAANPFACVVVGVSTGKYSQSTKKLWVEEEYFWDHRAKRAKTNFELATDVVNFIERYGVRHIYIDPSAASFKTELSKMGYHCIDANNDVLEGITMVTSEFCKGNLFILEGCRNTIREIQSYVWDDKKARLGLDEPLKKDDHCVDALRYVIATHKVPEYKPYAESHDPDKYRSGRFNPGGRKF